MRRNIGLWLTKRALMNPGREAYVDGDLDVRLTFAELNARCNRIANAFVAAGVERGERVALLLMNSAEFTEALFRPRQDRRRRGAAQLAVGAGTNLPSS